jgi:hypothetical protein
MACTLAMMLGMTGHGMPSYFKSIITDLTDLYRSVFINRSERHDVIILKIIPIVVNYADAFSILLPLVICILIVNFNNQCMGGFKNIGPNTKRAKFR